MKIRLFRLLTPKSRLFRPKDDQFRSFFSKRSAIRLSSDKADLLGSTANSRSPSSQAWVLRPNPTVQCADSLVAGAYDRPCGPIASLFLLSPTRIFDGRAQLFSSELSYSAFIITSLLRSCRRRPFPVKLHQLAKCTNSAKRL